MKVVGFYGDRQVSYQKYEEPTTPSQFVRKDINLRVPTDGNKYIMIKHDWDVLGDVRQYYNGTGVKYPFPAVVNRSWGLLTNFTFDPNKYDFIYPEDRAIIDKYNTRTYDYVRMTDRWQKWMYDFWKHFTYGKIPEGKIESYYNNPNNNVGLFAKATEGSVMWVYVNMIEDARSHTDSYSPEAGARDVPTNRNMQNQRGWEWLFRPTTGHLGKVVNEDAAYYTLEAIDILKPCPDIRTIENSPHLYSWATEVTTTKISHKPLKYVVSNYPQIEVAFRKQGLPKTGTPIPLLSLGGTIKIKKSSCLELKNGARWSPYVPEL